MPAPTNAPARRWTAQERPASYWWEQAYLAQEYAMKRPVSDLDGYFAAMRDSEEFARLALRAAEGGEG